MLLLLEAKQQITQWARQTRVMDVKVANISRLPQQLLAQVLSHVETAQRMGSCALVSNAWRHATVMATSSIMARLPFLRRSSLSNWLQYHAGLAPLDSITVVGQHSEKLQLPVSQLKLLRKLVLAHVIVTSWAPYPSSARTPVLPSALSAITHLELRNCPMQLSPALRTFTKLQHLTLRQERRQVQDSDLHAVADALRTMQHLTQLVLSGFACDAVLADVRHLPSLQVLLLESSKSTEASYAALPASLIQLQVSGSGLQLSPSSTPGLTQLTALQWLEVTAVQLDPAVLSRMQRLEHLALTLDRLRSAPNQPKLATLAGLTALRHLRLTTKEPVGATLPADVGALTVSSHLTFLNVSGGVVGGHSYHLLFPEGRQLPQLRSLNASMGLVSRHISANGLVECCPNLETLDLSYDGFEEPEWEEYHDDWPDKYPVVLLGCLTRLRFLMLNGDDHDFNAKTWQSIAHLKSLETLGVKSGVSWGGFSSIAALAACKQLTSVFMTVGADADADTELSINNTAPAGSPPDVWQRLPGEALELVLQHYDEAGNMDDDEQEALVCLARAAAGHTAELQAMQQQEHKQLQQELAELRQQQREQQQELTALRQQQQEQQQELTALRTQQQEQQQELTALRQQQQEKQHLQAEQQRQRQEIEELRAMLAAIRPQLQTQ